MCGHIVELCDATVGTGDPGRNFQNFAPRQRPKLKKSPNVRFAVSLVLDKTSVNSTANPCMGRSSTLEMSGDPGEKLYG